MKGGTTYRILSDQVGSVRLVVNATTGAIAQRIDYDAFGVVTADTNPGFQPFGFAGGLADRDTGLVRFGARDYDPVVGRWTSKDPIRFNGGGFNYFEYALSDPIQLVDRNGRAPFHNTSSRPVTVSGGPGQGLGHAGANQQFTLDPGQRVDVNNPVQTPGGPVTDADSVDFDGDGIADPPTSSWDAWPLGEKIFGPDWGLECSVLENPLSDVPNPLSDLGLGPPRLRLGPPLIPYPSGWVPQP